MGNSQSTPSSGRQSHGPSRTTSPRTRQTSLPDDPHSHAHGHHAHKSSGSVSSSSGSRRRKKSIELSDVDPALAFTHGGAGSGKHKHVAHPRRKHSDRVGTEILIDDDDDLDADEAAGEPQGTLRGAMQGRAEHVVYGPRRVDGALPPVLDRQLLQPATTASTAPTSKPKPAAISMPPPSIAYAAIDPDDTVHPGFKASPRLTSDVILSSDRMPVLSSPMHDSSAGNPFEQAQAAALSQAQSNVPPLLTRSRPDTPTTSLSAAASTIFAPDGVDPPISSFTASALPPPTTSPPFPSSPAPPAETVLAPVVPSEHLPISEADIPSGTSVLGSPVTTPGGTIAGSGIGVASGPHASTQTGFVPSPAVLLPPRLFNAPVAAIPIPLISVPSATIAANLLAAAVDLGAGADGIPTLIKWKDEDGQQAAQPNLGKPAKGPKEVFVTGTFAKGWKTKIELNKTDASDFSALISLPPGPHRLKFIVDSEWKASKHLPVATDADGNLINYLQVNPANAKLAAGLWNAAAQANAASTTGAATAKSGATMPAGSSASASSSTHHTPAGTPSSFTGYPTSYNSSMNAKTKTDAAHYHHQQQLLQQQRQNAALSSLWPGLDDDDPSTGLGGDGDGGTGSSAIDDAADDEAWTQDIPAELVEWGEWEAERDAIENSIPEGQPLPPDLVIPPPPASSIGVAPPSLPAQLEKGPLNHAAYVTQGSGDDNSILPKPDHSVINHLAASPIKGGFLSVGVTTRYKRKFVTVVYYKALASRG